MDNNAFLRALREGAACLGVPLTTESEGLLTRHFALLQQWNPRVNLTSLNGPEEIAEKHFLDSLALLPEIGGAEGLLDLGTGAGFPGVPLKVALPELEVDLVDGVNKKVGFLKQLIVQTGLRRIRAWHLHAEGKPEREGLQPRARVTARAVGPLDRLLPWVRPYVAAGGSFVASMGVQEEAEVARAAANHGWTLLQWRPYVLPQSGSQRAVAVLAPR